MLRTVEYGTCTRVGGTEEVRTSARIVAATNVDLEARVSDGLFLADLYDRLAFEVLCVPPLRERPEDIELLALHFLVSFQTEISSVRDRRLGPTALTALHDYDWPGNVRELKHVIERAAYRDGPVEIRAEDLDLDSGTSRQGDFEERVNTFKRRLFRDALAAAKGNGAAAARALGLTYDQFRYYRKQLMG